MRLSLQDCTLLMDNARVHLSKITKASARSQELRIMTLPPYCPDMAPVEFIFGMIKKRLSVVKNKTVLDYGKLDGRIKIAEAVLDLTAEKVRNLWRNLVEHLKEVILECNRKLILEKMVARSTG